MVNATVVVATVEKMVADIIVITMVLVILVACIVTVDQIVMANTAVAFFAVAVIL